MKNRIQIFNTFVDAISMKESISLICEAIKNNKQIHHIVINAGKVVAMQTDEELLKSVNSADMINADGQAIVWASKLLGKNIPERVAGIDLMENLIKSAFKNDFKIYFFGAKEEIISKVIQKYKSLYGSEIIAGYRNGYFSDEDEEKIANDINKSGANILFVAISSPKKENFLYKYKDKLANVNFIMGVGGSFDVVSGKVKRAPVWMQKIGLEWFYRFLQEPKRMWKRYLVGNIKFIFLVIKTKLNF